MNDAMSVRMKDYYEKRSEHHLLRRTPVVIRVDGRAFHSWTRGLKPFHDGLQRLFVRAAEAVAEEMQGFLIGYHQSDEVSFVLRDDVRHKTAAWFDYDLQKLASISASAFTAHFNAGVADHVPEKHLHLALFDARAFNVPEAELPNYLLWRMRDWERNSVAMLARMHFSDRDLFRKNVPAMHEMLHGVGVNWATMPHQFKNGTLFTPAPDFTCMTLNELWTDGTSGTRPSFEHINGLLQRLWNAKVDEARRKDRLDVDREIVCVNDQRHTFKVKRSEDPAMPGHTATCACGWQSGFVPKDGISEEIYEHLREVVPGAAA